MSTRTNPTLHSIGVVSRRTGLKPDVIRAWERRYKAIEPRRSETNRRFYDDEDVARLLLLRKATLAGRQIGQVSHLSTEELRELVEGDEAAIARAPRGAGTVLDAPEDGPLEACLSAVENLDGQALQLHLERGVIELTFPKLLEQVIEPLLVAVGTMWQDGDLRIAHEHLASSVVRGVLHSQMSNYVPPTNAPSIIVATPARQVHEMGALIVAAVAAMEGWRVVYLGADLPADEIAAAARLKGVEIVALSLVYPVDDPKLNGELTRLRRLLGETLPILVGGVAAQSYQPTLNQLSCRFVGSLGRFREELRRHRVGSVESRGRGGKTVE